MHFGGDTSSAWQEARNYRDEHERLHQATDHLAHAVADLSHAASLVGDHASAVALHDLLESLQLLQSQLATASEKALSLARLAARRAQHADLQQRADQALAADDPEP